VHANGFVLEAQKDSQRGIVAHIVLKNGVLKKGDEIVTRTMTGKIKILEDFLGRPVKEIFPSSPATIGTFDKLSKSGDEFWADEVGTKFAEAVGVETQNETAEAVVTKDEEGETSANKINSILKADSMGSLDALKHVLNSMVEIKEASVGDISDNDVKFAKSMNSIVIGFRVKAGAAAEKLADSQGVKIIASDIIYKLAEGIEALDLGESKNIKGGTLEVLKIFSVSQTKQTVGGKVVEGKLGQNAPVQIIRNEEIIGKGRIKNLQQGKEDIREVLAGSECGMVIATDTKIEVGDKIKIS